MIHVLDKNIVLEYVSGPKVTPWYVRSSMLCHSHRSFLKIAVTGNYSDYQLVTAIVCIILSSMSSCLMS